MSLTFSEIALPLATRGIPVIPVEPLDKPCYLPEWEKRATTDIEQIHAWNAENPAYNVGCVGKPNGFVILDCDVKKLAQRIEKETGQEFPPTLVVRSAGKGCLHLYFRQSDRSRKLGNKKAKGLFDLQSVDKYVVGPGSRLSNGRTYDIMQDVEIAFIPDSLCEWVEQNADPDKKKSDCRDATPVHEDFDFEDFCEFYEISGHQKGDWFVPSVCPIAGYQHESSPLTGFYWDGEFLGWNCFVTSCASNNMSIGQVIKFLNEKKGEAYQGVIWSYPEEDDFSGIAESVDHDDAVPEAPPVNPNGHSKECFFCHRTKAGGCTCNPEVTPQAVSESARRVKQENERHKPERDAHKARMAEAQADIREAEESEEAPGECECPDVEVRLNKRLTFGPMPDACLYGYLGELARKLESPLGYAYPTVLAVYASRWIGIATRTIRQNLFAVLLGDTSTGKTRTMNRSMSAVGYEGTPRIIDNAIGSGEGLVEKLGGKKDNQLQPLDRIGLPLLLHQDEMRELMAKMAIDNSSIPYKLNRLWERDDIGTQAKKSILTAYANASFLGGLTVESPAEFAALFGKGTVTGLYVRCIYGWAPDGWRFDDMWEELEKVSPEARPPNKNVRVPKEIFAMKNAWEMVDPKSRGQRLSQNALRIALVTAAANGDVEITPEGMRAALLFCEWQETLRSVYKPSRAESPGGKLSEAIMEEAWRHVDEEGNFAWFTWREAYRHNHWERQDGVALNKQRDHLRKNGLLETEKLEEGSKKTPRIKASAWSK